MMLPFNTNEDETEKHDVDEGAGAGTNSKMIGNVPVAVVSIMARLPADKSLEVAAAMLAKAACPVVGVVNFVTMTVTTVAALKVPANSFTVNTEPAIATEHVGAPTLGAVTAQKLVVSKEMPAPDSVMTIPALIPAVMACVGVNEMVAVVCVAIIEEARLMESPTISPVV